MTVSFIRNICQLPFLLYGRYNKTDTHIDLPRTSLAQSHFLAALRLHTHTCNHTAEHSLHEWEGPA